MAWHIAPILAALIAFLTAQRPTASSRKDGRIAIAVEGDRYPEQAERPLMMVGSAAPGPNRTLSIWWILGYPLRLRLSPERDDSGEDRTSGVDRDWHVDTIQSSIGSCATCSALYCEHSTVGALPQPEPAGSTWFPRCINDTVME